MFEALQDQARRELRSPKSEAIRLIRDGLAPERKAVAMTARLEAAVQELTAAIREELAATPPAPSLPDRLLSIPEAAQALGVSRTALYGELRSGRLRSVHVGRRVLIPASAITERINRGARP